MKSKLLKYIPIKYQDRLIENDKDGSLLIKIPAGEFKMGDNEEEDCPEHIVFLDDYYLGVFQVTNAQYKTFIEETNHRYPQEAEWGFPLWRNNDFPEEYADHPITCISWEDAQGYCNWANLKLPTEAQWEKAAKGPMGYKYPWGDNWISNNCLNYMCKGLEQTSTVYSFPEGISDYGIFNSSGNVLEWCYDWYDPDYYSKSPSRNPRGPEKGTYRVARGGCWGHGPTECRSSCRSEFNYPEERANFRGFRTAL